MATKKEPLASHVMAMVTDVEKARIREAAKLHGTTISKIVRESMLEWLKQHHPSAAEKRAATRAANRARAA